MRSDPVFVGVQSRDVPTIWPKVELLIARACKRSQEQTGPQRIRKYCETRKAQLWVVGCPRDILTGYPKHVIGCVVTQLRTDRFGIKSLLIWAFGANDLSVATQFLPELEERAKVKDCKAVELYAPPGRRGWVRVLKDYRIVGENNGSLHLRKTLNG